MQQHGFARFLSLALVVAAGAPSLGCGDDSAAAASTASTGGLDGDGPCGLDVAANSEFCDGSSEKPDCATLSPFFVNSVCGSPVGPLPVDGTGKVVPLERSSNVKESSGDGPPDISCFEPANYPAKPVSADTKTVTMSGVAKIFSDGCESKNLTIEVYEILRGGSNDGELGALVGTPVTTAEDCEADGMPVENDDCLTRYLCRYTYEDVPTQTELAVKTYGPNWAELYDYNVYISNDAVEDGVWPHDVRALASDDYGVIARAAIAREVTPGNGVIAGEVHDCGDVRLVNAVVDVNAYRAATTYFTDNEDAPLPYLEATATSVLGLYASFDVVPGPVTVAAIGEHNGKMVTLGFHRARIFPDAVTAVTFRGLRPYQVP
jgi:hypothetical protein